jgi:hypothetical protein
MHAAPYRRNADFILRYYIAGDCHTPDGKWIALAAELPNAKARVAALEAQAFDRDSKARKLARRRFFAVTRNGKGRTDALIREHEASGEEWSLTLQGARDELKTIQTLMAEIEPDRKYAHLSILEASAASHSDEQLGRLQREAENRIIGARLGIAHDYLQVMRSHPRFHTDILPRIGLVMQGMAQNKAPDALFASIPRIEGPVA